MGRSARLTALRNSIYYAIKPAIPRDLRLAVRSALARRIRRHAARRWPIDPACGRRPPGWEGWPNGAEWAVVLTHDVESGGGLSNVRLLAELEIEYGFRSAFHIIPEGEYRVPFRLIDWLQSSGFEVGVHDLHHDGRLFSDRATFRRHASRINHHLRSWNARGFRSGFMMHRPEWMLDLEITHDGSAFDTDPFEPEPFGCGSVFPYRVGGSERGFLELPTTLPQDSTLFLLLGERGIDVWKEKLRWIAARGGLALFNVHPDYLAFNASGRRGTYPVALYRELLEFLRSGVLKNAYVSRPCDLANAIQPQKAP